MSVNNSLRDLSVGLVAIPQTSAAVLYGLHELFASVGVVWELATGRSVKARRMVPQILAEKQRSLRSTLGVPMKPDRTFANSGDPDIILVPDFDLTNIESIRWDEPTRFVREQYNRGAVICSVCTGSVLLAEAGLLDGLDATTHWYAESMFRSRYPNVRLRPERILTVAGPGHRIVTGGGASSWNELALYLIARFSGIDEARRIAKVFLLGDRSEGQLPFATLALPTQHDDAVIAKCQNWISKHYECANPVEAMIDQSGLPSRTFARRFKSATGYTPIEYVQTLRVEEAKQLLESTDDGVDDIAADIGYDDPRSFRRLFKRATGTNPSQYRQRFRTIGSSMH
jgi:transcriptional regulator GlxA family with amidase domain